LNKKSRRFNVALFEVAFVAACRDAFPARKLLAGRMQSAQLRQLEDDPEFVSAMAEGTTQTKNVSKRIERARAIIGAL
jgi:hypothetical protein